MHKKPELTQQTRQNLMDAFWELYTEKRIEKITVREITLKAGYNRGTFYEYFTDVYHLLDEIEKALIPSVEELPAFTTSAGTMGVPLESFMTLYEKNSKYYSVLLGEKGDPAFAGKLKQHIKAGLLLFFKDRPIRAIELDYTLEYILSAMIGIMSYWFSQNQSLSKQELMLLVKRLSEPSRYGL